MACWLGAGDAVVSGVQSRRSTGLERLSAVTAANGHHCARVQPSGAATSLACLYGPGLVLRDELRALDPRRRARPEPESQESSSVDMSGDRGLGIDQAYTPFQFSRQGRPATTQTRRARFVACCGSGRHPFASEVYDGGGKGCYKSSGVAVHMVTKLDYSMRVRLLILNSE